MSLILTPSGGTQKIPNDAAAEFVKRYAGAKLLGQGTKTSAPDDAEFGSR
jgi:hypothetical protein